MLTIDMTHAHLYKKTLDTFTVEKYVYDKLYAFLKSTGFGDRLVLDYKNSPWMLNFIISHSVHVMALYHYMLLDEKSVVQSKKWKIRVTRNNKFKWRFK